jgi:hypothetical protein
MSRTGLGEHQITLAEAKALIKRFRDKHKDEKDIPRSHRIGREVVERILAQEGCTGLRIYHAHKKERDERGGPETLVIVGVTETGADLTAVIAEETWTCPPFCSAPSPLEAET